MKPISTPIPGSTTATAPHERAAQDGAAPRRTARCTARPAARRFLGFTLIELLVVVGVIATLAVLTATSVSRLSRGSRLAMGVNQVIAALGEARARAMKENQPMLVTFVVRPEQSRQVTDIVIGRWTGQLVRVAGGASAGAEDDVWNAPFEPHPEAIRRSLPPGIKVAGPRSDYDQDNVWITQPELSNNETGRAIGVLFSPDGTVITRLQNGIGVAEYEVAYLDLDGALDANDWRIQSIGASSVDARWAYDEETDEPNINYVRALAVFDDAAAREVYAPSNWSGSGTAGWDIWGAALPSDCSGQPAGQSRMRCEQSQFINQFAERINFNRFTGVAEVVKR